MGPSSRLVSHSGTTDNWEGELTNGRTWRVVYSFRKPADDPYHEQLGVITAFPR
jgi:hypothetical protein